MFRPKLDQPMHELRLAPRLLQDFQAAQRRQLNVKVAHFACPPANPIQHFQKFLLIPIAFGKELLQQRL